MVNRPPSSRLATANGGSVSLTSGVLPKWGPWAVAGISLLISFLLLFGLGGGISADANWVGLFVIAAITYLIVILVVSSIVEGRRKAVDRFITGLVASAFGIAMFPLVSVCFTVVINGFGRFDAGFFTETMRNVTGAGGGAWHAIVGTLLVTLGACIISIPIGIMTAVYLVEYGRGSLARGVTFLVDVMTGIPSIVAGLFAVALFGLIFGPAYTSGFMGSVALSLLMIPVVVRSAEEMLRLVPHDLREASYALGVPRWLTIMRVVLPTALAGLVTGVMLAIARVIGETAPLLLTAGSTDSMNWNLFGGNMETLPVFVYVQQETTSPADYIDRAWSGALTLVIIVMVLNLIARLISYFFAPKNSR